MYKRVHVKYPLCLSDFNETWSFSTDFWRILKYQILWKSVPWKPRYTVLKDGQTHMTKIIVAFRNFAKAPLRVSLILANWVKQSNVWETWDTHIDFDEDSRRLGWYIISVDSYRRFDDVITFIFGVIWPVGNYFTRRHDETNWKKKFLKERRLSLCCIVVSSYEKEQKLLVGDNRTLFCLSVSLVTDCH
jgi:hypothetical protein